MPDAVPPEQIFRSFEQIDFGLLAMVAVASFLILEIFERLVVGIAAHLPARFRFYILPWPPIARLLVVGGALSLTIPLILQPESGALTALLGTLALGLGFAFKDFFNGILAGVLLLFERPLTVGDWVRIGEHEGEVTAIELRSLVLRTEDDDHVTIPLSQLWTTPIANSTAGVRVQQVATSFHLPPEHDSRAVLEKLTDVALTSPFVSLERPVAVGVREEPFTTCYTVRAYPRDTREKLAYASDLTRRGRAALQRMGVPLTRGPIPQAG